MSLRIGQVLRYSQDSSTRTSQIDGLPNYFYETATQNLPKCKLDRGINAPAEIDAPDERRRPVILIRSSPHKAGSATTPWQDVFAVDSGHIRFFGDNKSPNRDPATVLNNQLLLAEFNRHQSGDFEVRRSSVPLIFFRTVPYGGRQKGHVIFQGFGIVEAAERVTQFDQKSGQYFANYRFDFAVLRMDAENEDFDWAWIGDRRNQSLRLEDTLTSTPKAWRDWIKAGPSSLPRCRRRVSRLRTVSAADRTPPPTSQESKVLREIYDYFDADKHSFELLALRVVGGILTDAGSKFVEGWVTPRGGDKGVDFVGRLDLGSGFSTAKLVVLGQAKCVSLGRPTSGLHLSRTVSRLRRGWLGAFVTTSTFSEPAQAEVVDDEYPLLLVDGLRLALETMAFTQRGGFASVSDYLVELSTTYPSAVRSRRPEEILLD